VNRGVEERVVSSIEILSRKVKKAVIAREERPKQSVNYKKHETASLRYQLQIVPDT
jgi:hypothetical protein